MRFLRRLLSKIRAFFYIFRKAEVMRNVVNKEINGEYDNLCPSCYFNDRYHERAVREGGFNRIECLRLSIYLGGALGDYIVYLRFVDEISSICECAVDLFLDRMEFAQFVYGKRENITIIYDSENRLFRDSVQEYDMALHLDHGVTLRHVNLGGIREKAPDFYVTACRIVEYTKANQINIERQNERESVILRRAKFLGESKWSKLSCGGAIDMSEKYSNVLLDPEYYAVLKRYALDGKKYITVNFGADKNMGGTAQTKVLPSRILEDFIAAFKQSNPDYLVVQTGVKNSLPLKGVDRCAFECRLPETAILLKNSSVHVDSEGGLVHMAAQMSTPCVVSFGPTPVYYYGYERNENIVSTACNDCMSVTGQWSKVCPRGMQVPVCMQAIDPKTILERVEKLLASRKNAGASKLKYIGMKDLLKSMEAERKSLRICLIGDLGDDLAATAQKLRQLGSEVNVFIPTALSLDVIANRTQLKKHGVMVEYGSALNIAKPDGAFDVVCCEDGNVPEELMEQANAELARLAAENGRILWYTPGKVAA